MEEHEEHDQDKYLINADEAAFDGIVNRLLDEDAVAQEDGRSGHVATGPYSSLPSTSPPYAGPAEGKRGGQASMDQVIESMGGNLATAHKQLSTMMRKRRWATTDPPYQRPHTMASIMSLSRHVNAVVGSPVCLPSEGRAAVISGINHQQDLYERQLRMVQLGRGWGSSMNPNYSMGAREMRVREALQRRQRILERLESLDERHRRFLLTFGAPPKMLLPPEGSSNNDPGQTDPIPEHKLPPPAPGQMFQDRYGRGQMPMPTSPFEGAGFPARQYLGAAPPAPN